MAAAENFRLGTLIELTTKPEWGPGKVSRIDGDKLYVIFRDLEIRASKIFKAGLPSLKISAIQSDSVLDNLPPLVIEDGVWQLPAERLLLGSALNKFEKAFPASFLDPHYVAEERDYKVKAHQLFKQYFGGGRGAQLLADGKIASVVSQARSILAPLNLIYPLESAALNDAMKDLAAAEVFYSALFDLVASPEIDMTAFLRYFKALFALPALRGRVASWPIATVFLLIADPSRFMLLKPGATRLAADLLAFDLHYDAKPNLQTYDALLRMGSLYLDKLKQDGARDFIDVQTFFFVVGGGYDAEILERGKAKHDPIEPVLPNHRLSSDPAFQMADSRQG